jgi:hypothetical protein
MRVKQSEKIHFFNPAIASSRITVLIPLCILAVPIFDAITVTLVRAFHGKPFWIGDHNHISHRFVRMGLTRKRAVQLVHILCMLTGLAAMPMLWGNLATTAVVTIQMVLLLTMITILQYTVIPRDLDSVVPPDAEKSMSPVMLHVHGYSEVLQPIMLTMCYYDAEGNRLQASVAARPCGEHASNCWHEWLSLKDYPHDHIWIKLNYSHYWLAEEPVTITVQ